MRVAELFEARGYGEPYSEEEKANLKPPSLSNLESAYIVGKTIFDNERGKGQVPYNQEVLYYGFALEMKPSDFLKIVSPGDREKDASDIKQKMLNGVPYGTPMLYISANIDEWKNGAKLSVKIKDHEGRARSMAFQKINGDVLIPVHFIPRGFNRKDITEKFLADLRRAGFIHQDASNSDKPIHVEIGKIWKS